jgi:beta-lactamase regulating signal transducer with metallopeptidase domain
MNAVASALLNGAILSAFLAAAIWLCLCLAPRHFLNAATRHMVWWMVLGITIALPVFQLPVHRARPAKAVQVRLPAVETTQTIPRISVLPAPREVKPARQSVSLLPRLPFPIEVPATGWLPPILWIWMGTSALLLVRLFIDYAALNRRKRRAKDVPPPLAARAVTWLNICGGKRKCVRLAATDEIDVPVAVGPRNLSILIPARIMDALESGGISDDALDQIGLHEAAHLARYDDYGLLLERVIEALFALHPVVRWITRQIDLEREIACDDFVVQATLRPRSYAGCLANMVELCGVVRPALGAAPVADDLSHLTRRVELLLDTTRRTGTRLLKARLTLVISIVVALACLAGKTRLVAFAKPVVQYAQQHFGRVPALMLPQVAALQQEPASAQELEGTVVEDSSGGALVGAELRFHGAGMRELAADLETDREGRFRAPGLPAGEYSVDVSKPNHITTSFRLRVPGVAPAVRLIRYGVIEGEATDSGGRPLPGVILDYGRVIGMARISVLVKKPGRDEFQIFHEAIPEDGRYRIFDLPPGNYALALWYYGLKDGTGMQFYPDNTHPRLFTVSGGEEYRDINFSTTPGLASRVSGKIDLPKPEMQFALALGIPDQPMLPIARTLTEKDGSFQFEKVPVGSYDLFVAGPTGGYTETDSILAAGESFYGRARIQVAGQNVEGLAVPVSPGRSFGVVLRWHNSESPEAGCPQSAAISITPLEPWGILFQTNARASFTAAQVVPNLPPGRFRVSAGDLGRGCYQLNSPVVDLSSDIAGPVAVELAAAGSIHGVLHAGSARPSEFAVVLLNAEGDAGADAQIAFPDGEGRFRFEGLRPGRYRIAAPPAAEKSSRRWVADVAHMLEVNVPGGKPVDVELAATVPAGGHP